MTVETLDAGMRAFLDAMARHLPAALGELPMAAQRLAWEEACRLFRGRRRPGIMVEDLEVGGTPVRIHRPPGEAPKPGVLYFHGGGWVMGSCETHDDIGAELASLADVVMVMPDYRLAPEHRHPAQIEDGLKTLDWMGSSGRALGIDPARIVAAGDSAGGQMAAGLAIALRDRGLPQVRGLALIYPALGADMDTPSYRANAEAPGLTRADIAFYLESFLGPPGSGNWSDPTALPNLAQEVAGLPPAFIAVAGHDPLGDDGRIMARRLAEAGIPVMLREEPALAHSYMRARHASAVAMSGFVAIAEALGHLAHEGQPGAAGP